MHCTTYTLPTKETKTRQKIEYITQQNEKKISKKYVYLPYIHV